MRTKTVLKIGFVRARNVAPASVFKALRTANPIGTDTKSNPIYYGCIILEIDHL